MIHAEKATTGLDGSDLARIKVQRMCDLLEVSRSGYYAWVQRRGAEPSVRSGRHADLLAKITQFHAASDQVYGAARITADLREHGEIVSTKTVAKIMRRTGIAGISPHPFTPVTTISDATARTIPDRVGRRFDQGALNRVWTSDITYLATGQGWLYLRAVRDGHSRRVIGYAFSESLHTDIVETALRRAVMFRGGDTTAVIFHADRGCPGGFNWSSQHPVMWRCSMVRRRQAADRAVRPPMRSPGTPPHPRETKRLFWIEIAKGLLPAEAAIAVGGSQPVGQRAATPSKPSHRQGDTESYPLPEG